MRQNRSRHSCVPRSRAKGGCFRAAKSANKQGRSADAHEQIAAAIDAWLAKAVKADATPAAMLAIWEQDPLVAHVTLGDLGPDLRALHAAGATAHGADLRTALRAFVISYISLIDALTGGILTPVLRKELENAVSPRRPRT